MARTAPAKPFRCPTCSAKFRSRAGLSSHMAEHAPPPRCTKCGGRLRSQFDHYNRCP